MSGPRLIEPLRPESLYDPCIKCTVCVTACPVAQVTEKFPGPKQAGPDAQRFRGRGEPVADDWINLCTACLRCQVACPADVPIGEINIFAKQRYAAAHGRDLPTRLLSQAETVMPLASLFAWAINPLMKVAPLRWLAEKLFGVARHAPLPRFASKRLVRRIKNRPTRSGRHKVAYFYGSYNDCNEPEVGEAILKVLEAASVEVVIPRQVGSGAALVGAGNLAAAQKRNRRNADALRRAVAEGCEAIIAGSPADALTLRHDLGGVLQLDAAEVRDRVYDLFSYLQKLAAAGELHLPLKPRPQFAAFHEACHLTALGLGANAPQILRRIPEFSVRELDAGCCGLSGTFGMKKKTFAYAQAIGREVAARIAAWGPDLLLSECEGCRLQLSRLTGVPAKHPAQILAEALDS